MTRLNWDSEYRTYGYGIDQGVLYFNNPTKDYVPWNGLVSVEVKAPSPDPKPLYFDGVCFAQQEEDPEYSATVNALYFPYLLEDHILALCDTRTMSATSGQATPFNLTYRTKTTNGYFIHLVYNVMASFGGYAYETISDDVNLEPFQIEIYSTPEPVPGYHPCPHFAVSSYRASTTSITSLENILYGSETSTPRFPTTEELLSIFDYSGPLQTEKPLD